jgi:UMF1 family MFS transporter
MSSAAIAACYLMIQFVAFAGALVAGRLADRAGHKPVIVTTLILFLVSVVWGAVMRRSVEFWVLGAVVGLIMGGNQAASRSLYSLLIPEEKATELFALFSVVGKASSLGGPFVFGLTAQFLGLRPAVAVIGLFFLVGGAVLLPLDEARGIGRRASA